MRERLFVLQPPRGALARGLWMVSTIAAVGILLVFGIVVVFIAAAAIALLWALSAIRRRGQRSTVRHDANQDAIEGEFVVVEQRRPRLP